MTRSWMKKQKSERMWKWKEMASSTPSTPPSLHIYFYIIIYISKVPMLTRNSISLFLLLPNMSLQNTVEIEIFIAFICILFCFILCCDLYVYYSLNVNSLSWLRPKCNAATSTDNYSTRESISQYVINVTTLW